MTFLDSKRILLAIFRHIFFHLIFVSVSVSVSVSVCHVCHRASLTLTPLFSLLCVAFRSPNHRAGRRGAPRPCVVVTGRNRRLATAAGQYGGADLSISDHVDFMAISFQFSEQNLNHRTCILIYFLSVYWEGEGRGSRAAGERAFAPTAHIMCGVR